ncbi:glycine cleavage system aminomethyltransferase GcvT [Vallicoccus soli]|uniref:Aminomethyltransferase n=1 Tax=Vallicoccus soli TaxID=2339232 RepID=A0A3A3Z221_9ACTN|nr:glycine cleavage system aminomethyltransferase GcvT [Vallicoccus soli]
MTDLLRSPLHDRHVALGARTGDFGGWEMPIQYAGVVEEHTAVREGVGVFDVSHLGKADVRGPGAVAFLDRCLTGALGGVPAGRAQYTLACDDASGGVVDDLIAYVRSDEEVFLVPNAANTAGLLARLRAAAPAGVDVVDRHRDFAVLAVQGPRADEVLTALGLPHGHGYMSFQDAGWSGAAVTVCRTGYTGERGYELVTPVEAAAALWDAVLASVEGVRPCGLGARDTLRTEMGYPLHGQDLTLGTTPVQAGASWAVGWDKPAFWGREVLLAERAAGPGRRLRGLAALDRGIPRPGMAVTRDGAEVGSVTSGTFSPTLKQGIGLALLDAAVGLDDEVAVDVRGRTSRFRVVKPPFVPSHVR